MFYFTQNIFHFFFLTACESEDPKHQMVHLAKQIIAAMPERIKSSPSRGDELPVEEFERERSSSYSSLQSASPRASSSYCESFGEDSGISTPMLDSVAFDEYRYGFKCKINFWAQLFKALLT